MKYSITYNNVTVEFLTLNDLNQWALENGISGELKIIPDNATSDAMLILAIHKVSFGKMICDQAIALMGPKDISGPELYDVLSNVGIVKQLLETGALGGARDLCTQLKEAYPLFDEVFTFVITQIANFESEYGL